MPDIGNFVQELALDAGKVLMGSFKKPGLLIEEKDGGGLVTGADTEAEELIISRLKEEFPDSSILAEESGSAGEGNGMKWIIDPLDGTSNYVAGLPWFCVSIGLEVEGEMELGCIYNPAMEELFFAKKGSGATRNGETLSVSSHKEMKDCLFATGFYYFKGDQLNEQLVRIKKVKEASLGIRRFGSAALDLAYTALGTFDGFWEVGLNPWDVAAGALMVQEAGGMVTDLTSGPDYVYKRNIIASNQYIYSKLLWLL
jgi:myo-inositol-1(or 4)-monophosphatase